MEAGTHSIWISEQLKELGHEVIVATCASCGRSRTAIVRATRWMLRSWPALRASIRKSSGPLRTAQSLSKKSSRGSALAVYRSSADRCGERGARTS
jgi:hypothetical protein